jgi:hypothetical protein
MLQLIFHDLEKHLGLVVSKDEKGLLGPYSLPINDEIVVYVKELSPGIVFKSVICPLFGASDREALFSYLMKANYIGQGTGGAIIAIDPEEKLLTLSLVLSYEVNYRIFKERLEEFINYLDYWKSELNRLETRQIV